jgi:potassium efflux system protein
MKMYNRVSFITLLCLLFCLVSLGSIAHSQEPPPEKHEENIFDQGKILSRIEEVQNELKAVEGSESAPVAWQHGISTEDLQMRTNKLRELETFYQRQLIAAKRIVSLQKERESLEEMLKRNPESMVAEQIPYNLSIYDKYHNQLSSVELQAKTIERQLIMRKKWLDDAQARVDLAKKNARVLKEQLESEGISEGAGPLRWKHGFAVLQVELARAERDLTKMSLNIAQSEYDIAQINTAVLKRQVEWIRPHRAADEEDHKRYIAVLHERRQQLEERRDILAQEQRGIENKWLEARRDLETSQAGDETQKARAIAYLKAREAWRETYQQVLEQTETMLLIVNAEEQIWNRRHSLLSGDFHYGDLDDWKQEAENTLNKIESNLHVLQEYQKNVHAQILSIDKQLGQNGTDQVLKRHMETRLEALNKSTERNEEFLTMVIDLRASNERLIDEISFYKTRIPVMEKLGDILSGIQKVWSFELWVVEDHSVTVRKVVIALLMVVIGMIVARVIFHIIVRRLLTVTQMDANASTAIEKTLYYTTLLVLIILALYKVNIPLTVFTFLGGAVAIGVGFGAQSLLNNFISGFILLFERPVKMGDTIEIDGQYGVIEKIGTRCTRIRTPSNIHILVPNSSFLEKNIINWTLADKNIRASLQVNVIYGTDAAKVVALMIQAVQGHERIRNHPEPFVLFKDFGDDAMVFELFFWINISSLMDKHIIESDLRFSIDRLFRNNGIVFAFPQRDVHLDITKPLEVRLIEAAKETAKF